MDSGRVIDRWQVMSHYRQRLPSKAKDLQLLPPEQSRKTACFSEIYSSQTKSELAETKSGTYL
jgi:hypothetical protein